MSGAILEHSEKSANYVVYVQESVAAFPSQFPRSCSFKKGSERAHQAAGLAAGLSAGFAAFEATQDLKLMLNLIGLLAAEEIQGDTGSRKKCCPRSFQYEKARRQSCLKATTRAKHVHSPEDSEEVSILCGAIAAVPRHRGGH